MIFFSPVIVKYIKKNLGIMKPCYSKIILAVPWSLLYRGSTVMVACVAGAKRGGGGRTAATQATVMVFLWRWHSTVSGGGGTWLSQGSYSCKLFKFQNCP